MIIGRTLLAGIMLLSAFVLSPISFAEEVCKKKLKIGVSLPLTAGPISSGAAVKNSILLADEKFDSNNCVEFLFADDQLQAKNTLTAVNTFIDLDHVDGIIVYGTPTSIAAGEISEKKKVPLIALSILGRVVEGKKYVVKHWCTIDRLHEAVVAEVKNRGYQNVAIISTQNDAMLSLRSIYVQDRVTDVVLDDEYAADINDFRSTVLKIKMKDPDAIYLLLYPPQTALFMRQLREQKYDKDVFGVHNIEDPAEIKAANGAMDGMWFANGDDAADGKYHEDYLQRFNTETSLGGGSGYDTARMFIEAAQQNGELNSYLHKIRDFRGAFGVYSSTSKNDFDFNAVIKKVQKDKFVKLNR